jgi:drug/metabolite transporter (DMT)-like permease
MMFLVGYLWFDEVLTWQQGLAGLMVLGAILLVPSRPSPGLTMVRRKRRLIPGRFYSSSVETSP